MQTEATDVPLAKALTNKGQLWAQGGKLFIPFVQTTNLKSRHDEQVNHTRGRCTPTVNPPATVTVRPPTPTTCTSKGGDAVLRNARATWVAISSTSATAKISVAMQPA